MAFNHGIRGRETATSLAAINTPGLTPVYVGTAPINMGNKTNVNNPVLCFSYQEAVENFGFVKNFEDYTLCEAIDAHFSKFGYGPIVLINILDTTEHKKTETNVSVPITTNKSYVIEKVGILKETLEITTEIQFITEFDDNGYLVIYPTGDDKPSSITVSYDILDPTLVENEDVIGGIDANTGAKKGLELISEVFPKYQRIPNPILAPKFSTDSTVAAVMETKASLVNGHFRSIALVDIDTNVVTKYSDVPKYKNDNNLLSTHMVAYYPKIALGERQYHLSTQIACIMQELASESEGVPYKSPSNINLKADKSCLANGIGILLGIDEANYLNENGINTAINFIGGWKAWGNRTSCFPSNTDPKDNFIASRMMTNFILNTAILNFWNKVDNPTNKVLIKTVVDSINIWLNGLKAAGMIIGAQIDFREQDNPTTSLTSGKIVFKLYYAPSLPAEDICIDLEVDVNYYSSLF